MRGTFAFIDRHQRDLEFYFVTNNTFRAPADYVARLAALGVQTDLDHIVTPLAPLLS